MPLTRLKKIRGECPDGRSCPAVYAGAPGGPLRIVGKKVTDPDVLAQMGIGDDETVVEVPAELLPEVGASGD
jgi:hypothetical protein